jgi:hypothetical protein
MTEQVITIQQKIKLLFTHSIVFWISYFINILIIVSYSSIMLSKNNLQPKPPMVPTYVSFQNLFLYYTLIITPSLIFSITFILLKNNSIQDYFSGIRYKDNIRVKLITKGILKHLYLINCLSYSFAIFGAFNDYPILFFMPIIYIIIQISILFTSNKYISVFNLLLNIKNRAFHLR